MIQSGLTPKWGSLFTILRPLQCGCFGRLLGSAGQCCTPSPERSPRLTPRPHCQPRRGVRGFLEQSTQRSCSSGALYQVPPSPKPIVSPGDNADKGPSLVGCLHQSVTMETPRETIPKLPQPPSALQLWLREPSSQQKGHY